MEHIDRDNATDLEPIAEAPAASGQAPGEGPLPLPPGAETAAPPVLPAPCLHVTYVGTTKKGKQRHGRALMNGAFEIATVQELTTAEMLIRDHYGLESVDILGWRLLRQ